MGIIIKMLIITDAKIIELDLLNVFMHFTKIMKTRSRRQLFVVARGTIFYHKLDSHCCCRLGQTKEETQCAQQGFSLIKHSAQRFRSSFLVEIFKTLQVCSCTHDRRGKVGQWCQVERSKQQFENQSKASPAVWLVYQDPLFAVERRAILNPDHLILLAPGGGDSQVMI